MSHYTKYRSLTTSELLSQLDAIRLHSPIINELIIRIEEDNVLANKIDFVFTRDNIHCPVCESMLTIDYDKEEDLFKLSTAS